MAMEGERRKSIIEYELEMVNLKNESSNLAKDIANLRQDVRDLRVVAGRLKTNLTSLDIAVKLFKSEMKPVQWFYKIVSGLLVTGVVGALIALVINK